MNDLKESYEYKLVKQLTSEENRSVVKDTIKKGLRAPGVKAPSVSERPDAGYRALNLEFSHPHTAFAIFIPGLSIYGVSPCIFVSG